MVNEVIDDLLLLAILDPEHMAGFKVNDMCRIPPAVVKLELVDAKEPRLPLGFYELAAIVRGIELLKAFFIDRLDVFLPRPVISATWLFV